MRSCFTGLMGSEYDKFVNISSHFELGYSEPFQVGLSKLQHLLNIKVYPVVHRVKVEPLRRSK
jgi:hypothetical protein